MYLYLHFSYLYLHFMYFYIHFIYLFINLFHVFMPPLHVFLSRYFNPCLIWLLTKPKIEKLTEPINR
ncbi:hypothetical protein Hanom_Chr10g00894811 [Helianthus anomalus]